MERITSCTGERLKRRTTRARNRRSSLFAHHWYYRRIWLGQSKRCLVCLSGPGGERKAEGREGHPHEEEGVSDQGAGDVEEAAR